MILLVLFFIYLVARLYSYIKKLESNVIEKIQLLENLQHSLNELVEEDFLLKDGRLKKFSIQKNRNRLYNGIKVEEQEAEF